MDAGWEQGYIIPALLSQFVIEAKVGVDTMVSLGYSMVMNGRLHVRMSDEIAQKIRIGAVENRMSIGKFIEILYKTYEQFNKQTKNN